MQLSSNMSTRGLRLAIVSETSACPAWLLRCHELLAERGGAIVALLCVRGPILAGGPRPSKASRHAAAMERGAYNPSGFDALAEATVPGCSVSTVAGVESLRDALKECAADAVLVEGHLSIAPVAVAARPLGCRVLAIDECWSDDLPAGFTRSWLSQSGFADVAVWERSGDRALRRLASSRCQAGGVALSRGLHKYLWSCAHLIARSVSEDGPFHVHEGAPKQFAHASRLDAAEWLAVTGAQMRRRVNRRLSPVDDSAWVLALAPTADPLALGRMLLDDGVSGFRILTPPSGHFWADPFLIEDAGTTWLFFEELQHEQGLGRIMAAPVDEHGFLDAPKVALERDWHLSYPNVMRVDGVTYMIPESGAEGRVDLFAATRFPFEWRHAATLLEGVHAYDATLFRHDARWWMFANVTDGRGLSDYDELHLFSSDHLTTGWRPHPRNPVVSDVTSARPGGAIVRQGNRILRPSQDSRRIYGQGLVVNEITTLTTNDYEERCLCRFLPKPDAVWQGMHTLNTAGTLSAIDLILPHRHRAPMRPANSASRKATA